MLVAGARPNFMKVAPDPGGARARGARSPCWSTPGQHYDARMSDAFFRDLGSRSPTSTWASAPARHAVQTARVMEAFEPVLAARRARTGWSSWATSTPPSPARWWPRSSRRSSAAASRTSRRGCAAATGGCPRRSTASSPTGSADLLLTPSRDARAEPARARASPADRDPSSSGNVMIDTLLRAAAARRASSTSPGALGLERGRYARGHAAPPVERGRPRRARGRARGARRGRARSCRSSSRCIRARARSVEASGSTRRSAALRVLEPLGYPEMLSLTDGAARGAHRLGRAAGGDDGARRPLRHAARADRAPGDGDGGHEPPRALAAHRRRVCRAFREALARGRRAAGSVVPKGGTAAPPSGSWPRWPPRLRGDRLAGARAAGRRGRPASPAYRPPGDLGGAERVGGLGPVRSLGPSAGVVGDDPPQPAAARRRCPARPPGGLSRTACGACSAPAAG